jgi:hypothetical protein
VRGKVQQYNGQVTKLYQQLRDAQYYRMFGEMLVQLPVRQLIPMQLVLRIAVILQHTALLQTIGILGAIFSN